MIDVIENGVEGCKVVLGGELTIYHAEELNKRIGELFSSYRSIRVDMADVEEMDTACFQVLLQKILYSKHSNSDFEIGKCSDSVMEIVSLFGTEATFNPQ